MSTPVASNAEAPRKRKASLTSATSPSNIADDSTGSSTSEGVKRTKYSETVTSSPPTKVTLSAQRWGLSGWSELNIDLIQSITPFLLLRELIFFRVCKLWLNIGRQWTLPARTLRRNTILFTRDTYEHRILSSSFLGRHIYSLTSVVSPYSAFHADFVNKGMPNLRSLTCTLPCDMEGRFVVFPPSLTDLYVTFEIRIEHGEGVKALASQRWQNRWACVEPIMRNITDGIPKLSSLVISFQLVGLSRYELHGYRHYSFHMPLSVIQPLKLAVNLTSFTLTQHSSSYEHVLDEDLEDIYYTSEHIQLFRSLTQLTYLQLDCGRIPLAVLSELLAAPIPFQFEVFILRSPVSQAHAPILARLQTVESLTCDLEVETRDVTFLSSLTDLTDLSLGVVGAHKGVGKFQPWKGDLVTPLKSCSSLMVLQLDGIHLQNSQLCELTTFLQLRTVALGNMDFDSLAFLKNVSDTLEILSVSGCRAIPLTELIHVRHLPHLFTIWFSDSFVVQFDSNTIGCFTPDSPSFLSELLPSLEQFTYRYSEPVPVPIVPAPELVHPDEDDENVT